MKAFLKTYGCQANERDSETIAGMLAHIGYLQTDEPSDADLIILNTCSIRDKAEQKVFSYLGSLGLLKNLKPDLVIGLCGCMAQRQETERLIRRRAPYVNFLLGTHRLHCLPEIISRLASGEGFICDREESAEIVESLPSIRTMRHKALINIMYGCDNYCSYCVVPYVRGRERSRGFEDIMTECRERVADGAVELMFLGQNVNAYGKAERLRHADAHSGEQDKAKARAQSSDRADARKEYPPFAELLREAQKLPDLLRIRFLTSHPKDFSEDLIQAIADCPKVARHIHLPAQSGSNNTLKKMNRGYTREEYLELVDRIRQRIPEITLTTDIIVGFPGETEEDFYETVDLLERVGFGSAFTFMYSARSGTAAEHISPLVPLDEKKKRLDIVMRAQAESNLRIHKALIGSRLSVLAEGWADGKLYGRGQGNQLTYFPGDPGDIGHMIPVRVTKARIWTLEGEALE